MVTFIVLNCLGPIGELEFALGGVTAMWADAALVGYLYQKLAAHFKW